MHKHCYMLPDRPANFIPKLSPEVDDLVCSLLAKDPSRRPASAAALLEELDRVRGKLERKGDRIIFPPDPGDPTGTHTPLAAGTDRTAGADTSYRRGRLIRAAALGTAFLLVVGLILFAFFRPRPPADELWAAAEPLLASDDPADWDRAAEEYLAPLERWHPDRYVEEVKAAKARVAARHRLPLTVQEGATAKYNSEAERLYYRGLRQAQAGDQSTARSTWEALVAVYGRVEGERAWVALARVGLFELTRRPAPGLDPEKVRSAVEAALTEAGKLRAAGQTAAADGMLEKLERLYADRPEALELIRNARPRP